MPVTAKQRRFFHAKAEQGERGMSSLADEADDLAKHGKELPPVKMYGGGDVECPHCGGSFQCMPAEYADESDSGGEHYEAPDVDDQDFVKALARRKRSM